MTSVPLPDGPPSLPLPLEGAWPLGQSHHAPARLAKGLRELFQASTPLRPSQGSAEGAPS